MPPKKTYKVGNSVFDIPDTEAESFLKDNSNAIEMKSFVSGKDTFDIPLKEVDLFIKDNPTAKPLYDDEVVEKKKDVDLSPSVLSVGLSALQGQEDKVALGEIAENPYLKSPTPNEEKINILSPKLAEKIKKAREYATQYPTQKEDFTSSIMDVDEFGKNLVGKLNEKGNGYVDMAGKPLTKFKVGDIVAVPEDNEKLQGGKWETGFAQLVVNENGRQQWKAVQAPSPDFAAAEQMPTEDHLVTNFAENIKSPTQRKLEEITGVKFSQPLIGTQEWEKDANSLSPNLQEFVLYNRDNDKSNTTPKFLKNHPDIAIALNNRLQKSPISLTTTEGRKNALDGAIEDVFELNVPIESPFKTSNASQLVDAPAFAKNFEALNQGYAQMKELQGRIENLKRDPKHNAQLQELLSQQKKIFDSLKPNRDFMQDPKNALVLHNMERNDELARKHKKGLDMLSGTKNFFPQMRNEQVEESEAEIEAQKKKIPSFTATTDWLKNPITAAFREAKKAMIDLGSWTVDQGLRSVGVNERGRREFASAVDELQSREDADKKTPETGNKAIDFLTHASGTLGSMIGTLPLGGMGTASRVGNAILFGIDASEKAAREASAQGMTPTDAAEYKTVQGLLMAGLGFGIGGKLAGTKAAAPSPELLGRMLNKDTQAAAVKEYTNQLIKEGIIKEGKEVGKAGIRMATEMKVISMINALNNQMLNAKGGYQLPETITSFSEDAANVITGGLLHLSTAAVTMKGRSAAEKAAAEASMVYKAAQGHSNEVLKSLDVAEQMPNADKATITKMKDAVIAINSKNFPEGTTPEQITQAMPYVQKLESINKKLETTDKEFTTKLNEEKKEAQAKIDEIISNPKAAKKATEEMIKPVEEEIEKAIKPIEEEEVKTEDSSVKETDVTHPVGEIGKNEADFGYDKIEEQAEKSRNEAENDFKNISDDELEKRQFAIDEKEKRTREDNIEYNKIDNELERREKEKVFSAPLEDVNSIIDELVKKDKEMPNGYGSYIERRDARQTKEVANKYLDPTIISDRELEKDFSDAIRGNPTTWYADGLKLRESLKEATNRGIDTKKMIDAVIKVYTNDGYSLETAKSVVAGMLKPILKGAKSQEIFKSIENEGKEFRGSDQEAVRGVEQEIPVSTEEKSTPIAEPDKNQQPTKEGEPEMIGITHEQMDNTAKELGLETYEQDPEQVSEWDTEAKERLAKDPESFNKLFDKLRKGDLPDKIETRMMIMYMADLKAKYNKNPTPERLNEIKRAKDLFNVAGREQGKSLRARQGIVPVEETLSDYHLRDIEYNKNAPLTEKQLEQSTKEYEEISAAKKALDEKVAQLEIENAKLKAEKEIKKQASATKKTKKVHGDFVIERKKITESITEKLKKARNETSAVIVPYAKELIAITPDVLKLVKSYVEEGIVNLGEIVKKVHGELKDHIPDIKEKDVHDIIAGEYSEKKKPRKKIAEQVFDLKRQAQLTNKLEKLLVGEEPKSEEKKVRRNQEIEELKNQIKDFEKSKTEVENKKKEAQKEEERLIKEFEKEVDLKKKAKLAEGAKRQKAISKELDKKTPEESALQSLKTRMANDIAKLENDLKTGNFEKEETQPIKLDKEATDLRDEYLRLKEEREIRLMKREYDNRTSSDKALRGIEQAINVGRVAKSSFDVSMPLRQGMWGLTSQLLEPPIGNNRGFKQQKQLKRQFGGMYKSFADPKVSRRIMADIHESPRFDIAQESGLGITEPLSKLAEAREEAYGPSLLEKVPIVKHGVQASERAATTWTNLQKWNIFNNFVDQFEKSGKTFENSKDVYEAAAVYANQSVGRGKLPESLEKANRVTSKLFFSLKLQASRLQLLTYLANPRFYTKVPKEIRIAYLKDMAKFVATGTTALAIANALGFQVGLNPFSSDFGKIKVGNTTIDIWGGFSQWATFLTRMVTGKKSDSSGIMQDVKRGDVLSRFLRSKASPEAGAAVNLLYGKDYLGNETNLGKEALGFITPLLPSDIVQAYQDGGVQMAFITALLASHGVGVQTITPKENDFSEEELKDPFVKPFVDNRIELPKVHAKIIEIEDKINGKPVLKKLSDYGEDKVKQFEQTKKDFLKKELQHLNGRVFVDKYGRYAITAGEEGRKRVKIDDLPKDEQVKALKQVMSLSGAEATKKAKEKLFPNH